MLVELGLVQLGVAAAVHQELALGTALNEAALPKRYDSWKMISGRCYR